MPTRIYFPVIMDWAFSISNHDVPYRFQLMIDFNNCNQLLMISTPPVLCTPFSKSLHFSNSFDLKQNVKSCFIWVSHVLKYCLHLFFVIIPTFFPVCQYCPLFHLNALPTLIMTTTIKISALISSLIKGVQVCRCRRDWICWRGNNFNSCCSAVGSTAQWEWEGYN